MAGAQRRTGEENREHETDEAAHGPRTRDRSPRQDPSPGGVAAAPIPGIDDYIGFASGAVHDFSAPRW